MARMPKARMAGISVLREILSTPAQVPGLNIYKEEDKFYQPCHSPMAKMAGLIIK
jgi:hypothetical protein